MGVGSQCGWRDQCWRSGRRSSHQRFHRRADLGRIAADLRVEQRLGDDLERQPHHVGLHVADLPVGPRGEHPLGEIDHEPA